MTAGSIAIALTIAGSDSSGGAGIQADLKTFSAFGVYGASAITALTAQNTRGVVGVDPVAASFVGAQIDAVLSDLDVRAIKTGMLADAAIVETVAGRLRQGARRPTGSPRSPRPSARWRAPARCTASSRRRRRAP